MRIQLKFRRRRFRLSRVGGGEQQQLLSATPVSVWAYEWNVMQLYRRALEPLAMRQSEWTVAWGMETFKCKKANVFSAHDCYVVMLLDVSCSIVCSTTFGVFSFHFSFFSFSFCEWVCWPCIVPFWLSIDTPELWSVLRVQLPSSRHSLPHDVRLYRPIRPIHSSSLWSDYRAIFSVRVVWCVAIFV